MLPFAKLSRRALVGGAALVAAVPETAAKKNRRKPKSKPKLPLALVAVVITGVSFNSNLNSFVWAHQATVRHPASGFTENCRVGLRSPRRLRPVRSARRSSRG